MLLMIAKTLIEVVICCRCEVYFHYKCTLIHTYNHKEEIVLVLAILEQHQYSTALSDYLLTLQVIVTDDNSAYSASSDWSV